MAEHFVVPKTMTDDALRKAAVQFNHSRIPVSIAYCVHACVYALVYVEEFWSGKWREWAIRFAHNLCS